MKIPNSKGFTKVIKENQGKRTGITDLSITNRIQEIEERKSGIEDSIEDIDRTVKENTKGKKLLKTFKKSSTQ